MRGAARSWAAGAIYAIGQINSPSTAPSGRTCPRVSSPTGSGSPRRRWPNKPALINKTLGLGALEPELTRTAVLEQHPLARLVDSNGLLVDARTLPVELQDAARRHGVIPNLNGHRAA